LQGSVLNRQAVPFLKSKQMGKLAASDQERERISTRLGAKARTKIFVQSIRFFGISNP